MYIYKILLIYINKYIIINIKLIKLINYFAFSIKMDDLIDPENNLPKSNIPHIKKKHI